MSPRRKYIFVQERKAIFRLIKMNESVKKGKFMKKIFFSDNVEWSSKNFWKMIPANVKANKSNKK